MSPSLDLEQEEFLATLVEAALSVERHEREFHVASTWQGGDLVFGGGLSEKLPVLQSDMSEFENEGLIDRYHFNTRGTYDFIITKEGYTYVEAMRSPGEPMEQLEVEMESYLRTSRFRSDHVDAYLRSLAAALPRSSLGYRP